MTAINNNLEYHKISQLEDELNNTLEVFENLEYYDIKVGKKITKKIGDKIDQLYKLRYQYDKKRLNK